MQKIDTQLKRLVSDFKSLIEYDWEPDIATQKELQDFLCLLNGTNLLPLQEREMKILQIVNEKLEINQEVFKHIIDVAAKMGIYFNYHQRVQLQNLLNSNDAKDFSEWLSIDCGCTQSEIATLTSLFPRSNRKDILSVLHKDIESDDRAKEILSSIFASYIFYSFSSRDVHQKNNQDSEKEYFPDFWLHLQHFYPQSIHRENGFVILKIDAYLIQRLGGGEKAINYLLGFIKQAYYELSNHCFLAIVVDPIIKRWEIISDIVLFAEKFIEANLEVGYFREKEIRKQTVSYIPNIREEDARFDLANEGFIYKDCIIFSSNALNDDYSCVLLFEKNQRDETLVPCPACRSKNVRGNSYPSLGVKSWECQNPFCPDRSKYNRGKRYSLQSLVKQQALLDERNYISREYLKLWRRDVVRVNSESNILEMLVRLYSLVDDRVVVYNISDTINDFGRNILFQEFIVTLEGSYKEEYFKSHYFRRYKLIKQTGKSSNQPVNLSNHNGVEVYHGDAFDILSNMKGDSVDGAVTSPPYYNAKEYSNWANIYCYLYDMFNIGKEVFRVLKHGAPYIFNIFDYFDNENNIVLSAMGKKRMILGYYIVDMFRDIGYNLCDNIVWDKGEIEGKRNFNQGNLSPYYQAPHNCWEHVFVFSKGVPSFDVEKLPKILFAKPVYKFVNGENVLGHSAPFPIDVPNLLFSILAKDSVVLDPFAGSMTTGRYAHKMGYKSINIDYKAEFCQLGLKLLAEEIAPKQYSFVYF